MGKQGIEKQNISEGGKPSDVGCKSCCGPSCSMETGLKACQQCKSVWYCSRACQKRHWRAGHKKDCKHMTDARKVFKGGKLHKPGTSTSGNDIEQVHSINGQIFTTAPSVNPGVYMMTRPDNTDLGL